MENVLTKEQLLGFISKNNN